MKITTWKTISSPTKKITKQLLEKEGCGVFDWANEILEKVKLPKKKETIELVQVSVADLGFPDGACLKDIYAKAKELGLEICPSWVGPQLRLQYKDQSHGEWILIGMKPITDSGGYLEVFNVEHGDHGLWLYGFDGNPDSFWDGYYRWVFRRKMTSDTGTLDASVPFDPSDIESRVSELEKQVESLRKFLVF